MKIRKLSNAALAALAALSTALGYASLSEAVVALEMHALRKIQL